MASENDQVERAVHSLTRAFQADSKTSIQKSHVLRILLVRLSLQKSRARLDMPVTASNYMCRDDDLHPTDIIPYTLLCLGKGTPVQSSAMLIDRAG